MHLCISAQ